MKPQFLKKGMTIGVCAPSFGCSDTPYLERYQNAKKVFTKLGYKIKESKSVNSYYDMCSAPREQRAKEFMDLMLDDEVDFIFSCGGGEIMTQILPYIDFDKIKNLKKKKFFMGYSDNTNLTFTLPIFADTPAIYGECFPSFGYKKLDVSKKEALEKINGNIFIQHPYPKHEDITIIEEAPLIEKKPTLKASWKRFDKPNEEVTIKGISIGGCGDVIAQLLGTKWGKIDDYLEAHKKEGFIWFIETCDLNVLDQLRLYWSLIHNNYFKYCNGIVVGRPLNNQELFGHVASDMLSELLSLNIPIIYDFDIGHVKPMITLFTGVSTEVHYEPKQKECYIKQDYK